MKKLLICTIARDAALHLDTWWRQIQSLTYLTRSEWEVYVAVAENDSVDGTDQWIREMLDQDDTDNTVVATEKLGTQKYPSIWSVDRICNLAAARNRCLALAEERWGLGSFEKIAYIEPDVTYDARWCSELILARHPAAAGIEPDIYSGWSLRTEAHPKESTFLYDTCATRATKDDLVWDVTEDCGRWRGRSLVRTDLGGVDSNCLHRVWSTFNCFCVYRAAPFIAGAKWGFTNPRLNTGQPQVSETWESPLLGYLDADTSVMCETFHTLGYSNVLLNTNCLVRHT